MTKQRFVILTFIVAAVLSGMVGQSASLTLFDQMSWTDDRLAGLVNITTLLGVLVGGITFFGLLRSSSSVKFTDEVIGELMKVTWPSREETLRATTTVIFTTLFVAALLGFYDFVWKNVADVFLFTEG